MGAVSLERGGGPARATVLCVDDEPNVLTGLGLNLGRRYRVLTASTAAGALELLRGEPGIAVVVSDMRMPVMDGAAFLQAARELAPTATRLLLTGQADLHSAIAAVNHGQVFRFLTKPCPPESLLAAIADAVEQHRLVLAERELLEQTLQGSIQTLVSLLAMTNPPAFGRAVRVKALVSELATRLRLSPRWQLEVAAMLLPLGLATVPPETVEKVYYGLPLEEEEKKAVARCAATTEQLLAHIPRLELVRATLAWFWSPGRPLELSLPDAQLDLAERSAAILRGAVDFDVLEAQGHRADVAVASMRAQSGRYPGPLLQALEELRGNPGARVEWRELPAAALRPGMVFAEDLKLVSGALLVPRGMEVTPAMIERLLALPGGVFKGPLRVLV